MSIREEYIEIPKGGIIVSGNIGEEDKLSNDDDEQLSLWVKDKDIISPSTNLTLMKQLEPGIYTVHFSREAGLYCKKLDNESDELFVFKDAITQNILNEIVLFWEKEKKYSENKLLHKRGILLEGFPGTGKSSLISLLSNEIISRGGLVFKVTGFRNLDYYVDFITTGLREIQPDTPIITIIEDLDQYTADPETESLLLDFLDGKLNVNHHVVLATTNNTEEIPDTFLRPSRIDLKVEMPLPSEDTRREYFEYKKVPQEDIDNLVKSTGEFTLADLKELYICIYVLDYSVDDAIKKINTPKKKKNYVNSHRKSAGIGL